MSNPEEVIGAVVDTLLSPLSLNRNIFRRIKWDIKY